MGQYWNFYNFSRRQYMSPHGGSKFGEFFFVKQAHLVRWLARPYPRPELAHYLKDAPPPGITAKKGLLSLPDELLVAIIEDEDTHWLDSACLAVTCKKLLSLSRPMFVHYRDFGSACFARCRIACVGDCALIDEAPDHVFPPGLKEELRAATAVRYPGGDERSGYARLMLLKYRPPDPWQGAWTLSQTYLYSLPERDRRLVVAATGVCFPERADWVLVNTSKKELVRAGALAALARRPGDAQPFLPDSPVDLGTALMARFAWSSSDDLALPDAAGPVRAHEGKWAGDRCCITTLERLQEEFVPGSGDWACKDVSDEVVADIVALYKVEFGEDWERELARHHGPFKDEFYSAWDSEHRDSSFFPDPRYVEYLHMFPTRVNAARKLKEMGASARLGRYPSS
ncbi:hypothetical protein BD413DRAFT_471885 [Trametes elegans]|nr:hypothetical protein BD413DRAFT_471885 [Trametes elegans]